MCGDLFYFFLVANIRGIFCILRFHIGMAWARCFIIIIGQYIFHPLTWSQLSECGREEKRAFPRLPVMIVIYMWHCECYWVFNSFLMLFVVWGFSSSFTASTSPTSRSSSCSSYSFLDSASPPFSLASAHRSPFFPLLVILLPFDSFYLIFIGHQMLYCLLLTAIAN